MARGQLYFTGGDEPEKEDQIADALAAVGLVLADPEVVEDDEFCLWPENCEVFEVWRALQTQWVETERGLVGLNYSGVESLLRLYQIKSKKRMKFFCLIQAMEAAVVNELNKSR